MELAFSSQPDSARGRVCSAAGDALRQQSSPQPCCSACVVSRAPQQCHCLWPVTETTSPRERRQPCRRGGALVLVVERCLRRPTPSQRASAADGVGRERAELSVGHSRVHGRCATDTPRRRHRGMAAAPTSQRARPPADGDPTGHRVSVSSEAQPSAHGLVARRHASPTPRRGVVHRTHRADGPRAKGKGSVRTTKPAPSEYPHATALGANLRAETKPARFASGLWVDPPEGWVDWVWLIGYKRGVRERDEACETRSR